MAKRINVRLIMQLHESGMSQNDIATSRHMSKSSISKVLATAKEKNITYEDIRDRDDTEVYKLFFPDAQLTEDIYELPDYSSVDEELKRVGVTLMMLWKEYCDRCREHGTISVGKTKFCEDYARYCQTHDISNHLDRKPGERCEVDWSGPTMKIVNKPTGEAITVYLFVSCLSYSRYAYVEATLNMKMDTWLRCHVHMYEAFGGVPTRTICDNLKTGVVRHPKEGEIVLTDSYEALGLHYMTAIMPAAVKKPKQKPSVENTVGNIATAVIAALRHRTFYDMPSLQRAVKEAVQRYNTAPFQKRSGSRSLVYQEEKSYLRPLPSVPYEVATLVENRKVYPNCHVSLLKNWYSVPYIYRGMTVDIRYTESTAEIYYDHQRIASHPKFPDYVKNRYSTRASDMPDEFNKPEMNKDRMCSWASSVGPNTRQVVDRIFSSVRIKEQGYNAALSVLNLSKHYSNERFEDACQIALANTTSPRYKYLKAILASNQDIILRERKTAPAETTSSPKENTDGAFVRGASYYGGGDPDDQ